MKFRTTILQGGKTATGIEVPESVMEALGAGRKPAVRVTIGDYTYRSSVATVDGKSMVGVSAEHRAGAGVAGACGTWLPSDGAAEPFAPVPVAPATLGGGA